MDTDTPKLTSEILVAYSQCPRKAFLLLCTEERGTQHDFVRILEHHRGVNRAKCTDALRQQNLDVRPYGTNGLDSESAVLIEAKLKTEHFEAYCDILTRAKNNPATGRCTYEPTIVIGTYGISKEQWLELLFAGYALGEIQGKFPLSGSIVAMGGYVHKVKLENCRKSPSPLIEKISTTFFRVSDAAIFVVTWTRANLLVSRKVISKVSLVGSKRH